MKTIKLITDYLHFDLNQLRQNELKTYTNVYNQVISFFNNDQLYLSGWLTWPNQEFYQNDYLKINYLYDFYKQMQIDKFVVIGIGGSYIGTKAGLMMLADCNQRERFIFVSNTNADNLLEIKQRLVNQNWALIVISKSGKTIESAINFRFFRELLKFNYGDGYSQRIVVISDINNGILTKLSDYHHYYKLSIPYNIGGRYSTITSVGLLVFKLANLDIDQILNGYKTMIDDFINKQNIDCLDYALIRYHLLKDKQLNNEVFITYDNKLRFISEHYKQVFAESEGKKEKCLIPTIANFSDDLHSIGQLYQQGNHSFFETILLINHHYQSLVINQSSFNNDDQLDELVGLDINEFEKLLVDAAIDAHFQEAQLNCLKILIDKNDEYNFGALMAFLNLSACCSACFLNVNPFDQPGVEAYKQNLKSKLKTWANSK